MRSIRSDRAYKCIYRSHTLAFCAICLLSLSALNCNAAFLRTGNREMTDTRKRSLSEYNCDDNAYDPLCDDDELYMSETNSTLAYSLLDRSDTGDNITDITLSSGDINTSATTSSTSRSVIQSTTAPSPSPNDSANDGEPNDSDSTSSPDESATSSPTTAPSPSPNDSANDGEPNDSDSTSSPNESATSSPTTAPSPSPNSSDDGEPNDSDSTNSPDEPTTSSPITAPSPSPNSSDNDGEPNDSDSTNSPEPTTSSPTTAPSPSPNMSPSPTYDSITHRGDDYDNDDYGDDEDDDNNYGNNEDDGNGEDDYYTGESKHPSSTTEGGSTGSQPTDFDTMINNEKIELNKLARDKTADVLAALLGIFGLIGMIITAWQIMENPDGLCTSCCRLAVKAAGFLLKIIFLPCRLCCSRNKGYNGPDPSSPDNNSVFVSSQDFDRNLEMT